MDVKKFTRIINDRTDIDKLIQYIRKHYDEYLDAIIDYGCYHMFPKKVVWFFEYKDNEYYEYTEEGKKFVIEKQKIIRIMTYEKFRKEYGVICK